MITLSNVHLIAAAKNIGSCGMFDKYLKEQISLDRILISSISNIRKLKHDLGNDLTFENNYLSLAVIVPLLEPVLNMTSNKMFEDIKICLDLLNDITG